MKPIPAKDQYGFTDGIEEEMRIQEDGYFVSIDKHRVERTLNQAIGALCALAPENEQIMTLVADLEQAREMVFRAKVIREQSS